MGQGRKGKVGGSLLFKHERGLRLVKWAGSSENFKTEIQKRGSLLEGSAWRGLRWWGPRFRQGGESWGKVSAGTSEIGQRMAGNGELSGLWLLCSCGVAGKIIWKQGEVKVWRSEVEGLRWVEDAGRPRHSTDREARGSRAVLMAQEVGHESGVHPSRKLVILSSSAPQPRQQRSCDWKHSAWKLLCKDNLRMLQGLHMLGSEPGFQEVEAAQMEVEGVWSPSERKMEMLSRRRTVELGSRMRKPRTKEWNGRK